MAGAVVGAGDWSGFVLSGGVATGLGEAVVDPAAGASGWPGRRFIGDGATEGEDAASGTGDRNDSPGLLRKGEVVGEAVCALSAAGVGEVKIAGTAGLVAGVVDREAMEAAGEGENIDGVS